MTRSVYKRTRVGYIGHCRQCGARFMWLRRNSWAKTGSVGVEASSVRLGDIFYDATKHKLHECTHKLKKNSNLKKLKK